MQYKLPNMEYAFEIQCVGKETGINWVGNFKYKRPTLAQRSMIEAFRAKLTGDLYTVDMNVQDLNEALAHLRFTLIEYPDWWKDSDYGGALFDYNLVMEVYTLVVKYEEEWRKKIHGGDSEDVSDGTKTE